LGGLFYVFILVNRGESAQVGDIFSGFQRGFGQLFLGVLVPGLLMCICMSPAIMVLIVKLIPLLPQLQQFKHMEPGTPPDPQAIKALFSIVWSVLPVLLICAVPVTYLAVCWKFTLALIVDQEMDFATAMRASWKMVNKHWWMVFGLVILISLLNLAGFLACCIGLVFTVPIGFGALMTAYETIFGAPKH
jgi:hypothetical protein